MAGIILVFFLLIVLIGLSFEALLQMLGGKLVAKLETATFGSAFVICLIASIATGIAWTLLDKIGLLDSFGIADSILFIVLLWIPILTFVTKLKWKYSDMETGIEKKTTTDWERMKADRSNFITALKASSINIIFSAICWLILYRHLVNLYKTGI